MSGNACRFCRAPLFFVLVDLGMSPPSNSFVPPERVNEAMTYYPLRVFVCDQCWLVQLPAYQTPAQTFSDYAYFSSYSTSWMEHLKRYARAACERFELARSSVVVEIASNDGGLLRLFRERGLTVLGIEPARNVAAVATAGGIPTLSEFFGEALARKLAAQGQSADLIVANNVLAHVPDLNGFVAGLHEFLKPEGVATLEFPLVAKLLERTEFDTIYHEHLSYFSLGCVRRIFEAHRLVIFDVDELPTHGGSLRIYAARSASSPPVMPSVERVIAAEQSAGLEKVGGYRGFDQRVRACKHSFMTFLLDAANSGDRVAGYGAPAKATTLLNSCGAGSELIEFTVDRNPYKQGKLIPGVRVPIKPVEAIFEFKPHYVVVFPWNIADEIVEQLSGIRAWGGRFVVPIPSVNVLA